jgi:DNA-directed RNA polymerase specialized sigma subunit
MTPMTTQIDETALSQQAQRYLRQVRSGCARNYPRQIVGRLEKLKSDFIERMQADPGSIEADKIDEICGLKPLSLQDEIILAAAWINDRDEAAREALLMSHLPRMVRVLLGSRVGCEDWLDILNSAIVEALLCLNRMTVYDYESFKTTVGLAILHHRTRFVTRMRRPLTGPRSLQARKAANRILFHDPESVKAGTIDLAMMDKVSMKTPVEQSEMLRVFEFLTTEDTDEIPEQVSTRDNEEVEYKLDAARIHSIIEPALDDRAQDIIRRRWLTEEPEDAEVLAKDWQITPERVRQIERQSIVDLRAYLEGRKTYKQTAQERQALKLQRQRDRLLSKRRPNRTVVKGVDLFAARKTMKVMIGETGTEVLSRRFFDKPTPPSHAQVAKDMQLSAADIRQIEVKSLEKLREQFAA